MGRAKPMGRSPDQEIYFHAERGELDAVKKKLEAGNKYKIGRNGYEPDVFTNNGKGKKTYTALHVAASHGHTDICVLLMRHGWNPDKKDSTEQNAMSHAMTPAELAQASQPSKET